MNNLEKREKELAGYLEANPHLKEYQKELDKAMDAVGDDTYKRLQVFCFFLSHNLQILKDEFDKLSRLIEHKEKK